MKPLKSGVKEQPAPSPDTCKIHKQLYSMICLHAGCHSNYKLLCLKCKKQKHYQHPNRTISLTDFYQMLQTNKLDFIENCLALTLVNIKNKLFYVSNFRIFIMQKQAMLMENARTIHSIIYKILQEKTHLKQLLSAINNETQISDTQMLIKNLEQIKKHISFNPIQNVIRINSEKVGVLKVELEKQCQTTKTVINDIRQYLVKIVEVMIEEQIQEDDIQYIEHQDVDQKIFNINIKKANHIEINEKQTRYKVQQLTKMFDELLHIEVEKNQEHIENDVQKLQEQIKIKQQIVKNIRSRSASKAAKYSLYDQIKQTTTPPGKSSLNPSEIQQNTNQKQKNPSKISLNNPKLNDSKLQPKNITKYPTGSPKSPKMRSITDKGSTSPKGIISKNDTPKNGNKQYGINKRTPKSQFKNKLQESTNEIKQKKSNQNQQKQFRDQRELVLQSNIQKIDQSQEEQLLHTENFNYRLYRESLKNNNQDQSLLLDTDSPKKIKEQKITELEKKIIQFQHQNKLLQLQIDKKTKQILTLESNFQQYKHQMEKKLKSVQPQLKQTVEKSKIDQVKEIPVKQGKSMIHSSPGNNNKERKTPQKQEDKLLKKAVQQNAINTKKLMDQKKQLEGKIQKLEKQVKQLKEKEINYKKQHSTHTQNVKELKEVKKRLEQFIKKNEQLSKKNDDTIKKYEQLSKKSDDTIKKNEQLSKKNDEFLKRMDEINKNNDEIKQRNEQLRKKNEQMNKKNEEQTKNSEQMRRKNDQLNKRLMEHMSKLEEQNNEIKEYRKTIEHEKIKIEELTNLIEQQNHRIKKQKQQFDLEYQLQLRQLRHELQQKISISETKVNNLQKQLHHLQGQLNQFILNQASLGQQLKQAKQLIETQTFTINNYQYQFNKLKLTESHQIQLQTLMTLNHSLQNQLTQKSIALQDKQKIIQNNQQTIRINDNQIQQLKAKIQELVSKEQDLYNANKGLQNKIVKAQSVIKEHLTLIESQKSVIKQKQKQITELNKQNQQQNQLLKNKQQQLSYLNQYKQQLLNENNQFKQKLTSKSHQNDPNSVTKLQQLEELAQKRIGQKIWLKDLQIQQLQQRNKLLSTQLNQLKLKHSMTDRYYFSKNQSLNNSLKNSISLNDSSVGSQNNQIKQDLANKYNTQLRDSLNSPNMNPLLQQQLNFPNKNPLLQQQLNSPNKNLLLQQQINLLKSKYHKLEQKYHKLKNRQVNHLKDHDKMKHEMMLQCQFLKTKYQEQKQKNEQYSQFDIKNYVPLLKHKQLKEWYEIAMRKNHDLKQQITAIKLQQSRLKQLYQEKITQTINQCQTQLNSITNNYQTKINQFNFKQQTKSQVPSTSFESISPIHSGQLIRNYKESTQSSINQINAQNSPIMLQKYSEISSIIHQITGDMLLLQQKVKENAVIQKVYLKELDRKRTQNRKLRQQIDQYRNRERKLVSVKTDRYFEKGQLSKGKLQKPEYKVYYATGFAGSESRLSGGGSSLIPGHQYHIIQDKFSSSSPSPSTLSENSNML